MSLEVGKAYVWDGGAFGGSRVVFLVVAADRRGRGSAVVRWSCLSLSTSMPSLDGGRFDAGSVFHIAVEAPMCGSVPL